MLDVINKKSDFNKIISESNIPVVAKFFATWCGPCKMIAPVFEKLSQEFENQVKFIEINVDDCEGISGDYYVSSVPTFIVFKNGEEFNRTSGALAYEQLENFIKSATAVV